MPMIFRLTIPAPLAPPALMRQLDTEVSAALTEMGALGERLFVERTPAGVSSGGGGLRGSAFHELRGTPGRREEIIGFSSFYAPIVEAGRRPGRRPPAAALVRWVTRKLGATPDNVQHVAFLVSRKIGAQGYTGYHMVERSLPALQAAAMRRFADIARRLGGR